MQSQYPKVGVGILVQNPRGDLLLSERVNSHGAGSFTCPGGHLEFAESFQDCAARELREETGIEVLPQDIAFHSVHNNIFGYEKHYVSIIMYTRLSLNITPETLEPTKEMKWQWHNLHRLPVELFEPLQMALATKPLLQQLKEVI